MLLCSVDILYFHLLKTMLVKRSIIHKMLVAKFDNVVRIEGDLALFVHILEHHMRIQFLLSLWGGHHTRDCPFGEVWT